MRVSAHVQLCACAVRLCCLNFSMFSWRDCIGTDLGHFGVCVHGAHPQAHTHGSLGLFCHLVRSELGVIDDALQQADRPFADVVLVKLQTHSNKVSKKVHSPLSDVALVKVEHMHRQRLRGHGEKWLEMWLLIPGWEKYVGSACLWQAHNKSIFAQGLW